MTNDLERDAGAPGVTADDVGRSQEMTRALASALLDAFRPILEERSHPRVAAVVMVSDGITVGLSASVSWPSVRSIVDAVAAQLAAQGTPIESSDATLPNNQDTRAQ